MEYSRIWEIILFLFVLYEIISVSEYLLTTTYWKLMEMTDNFLYVQKYF